MTALPQFVRRFNLSDKFSQTSWRDLSLKTSRFALIAFFSAIFVLLLTFTIRASMVRHVFDNGPLMSDVWFQATLLDAYFGFLTFYVWVAWKERTLAGRIFWFVLIMALGNMAMSAYVILQLVRLPAESRPHDILVNR